MLYALSMNTEKLKDIEVLLTHQDRQIQDLSDMLAKLWREVETLKQRLSHTQDKLKAVEEAASAARTDTALDVSEIAAREKPPHY